MFNSFSTRTKLYRTGKTHANKIVPYQTAPKGAVCLFSFANHFISISLDFQPRDTILEGWHSQIIFVSPFLNVQTTA